jgi:acetate kinase
MTARALRRVLVVNAGSSSLKCSAYDGAERRWSGQVEGIGSRPRLLREGRADPAGGDLPPGASHAEALAMLLRALEADGLALASFGACGHRIVHGGLRFVAPMVVDGQQLGALNELRMLAPLHNGYGLDAIEYLRDADPAMPQVACFDTAFHATQPELASRYALPASLHEAGYRRYGFHGLNYEHVTREVASLCAGAPPARLLVFHLGNGCSAAAVRDGRSVATTMGYSTLDGLDMGTRSGSIDPGVLIALQRDRGMTVDEVADLLYRRSGLLGLSGTASDMRTLEQSDDPACRFAIAHFAYWAARHAGSLTVAMGGLDAVVFTGGIGAGSAAVRAAIAGHLGWLGLDLDAERNAGGATLISGATSRCRAWIIAADEERVIARHVANTLWGNG